MISKISYDPRYTPSEEVLEKLELSRQEAEELDKKELTCPICNFRIAGVYSDKAGHLEVKCRKCKFEGIINLAYFRRQQSHHRYIRCKRRTVTR